MSQLQGCSSLKRKRLDSKLSDSLTEQERILYDAIHEKKDKGIWTRDLKQETKLENNVVTKSLKSLQAKKLIKEAVNIRFKGRVHYMAAEFEPSEEISGGVWYADGSLDTIFIDKLKDGCANIIKKQRVGTVEGILDVIRRSGICNVNVTGQHIEKIVRDLVLDNRVMEVESNGMGEFDSIPIGKVCYKCTNRGVRGESNAGAMASIPCGVCPRISYCTPHGIISPTTCIYYTKWLDF